MDLRQLHALCGSIPTRRIGDGAFAFEWLDGRTWVNFEDETGIQCGATLEDYGQRMAGLRRVRFVADNGECLKEIDMNRFLELAGSVRKREE